MGNSLGKLFVITSFGESHGRCIGAVIDGCPAGLPITEDDIQQEVDKRKPVGIVTSSRVEEDKVEILSGILNGTTTGAPICLLLWNKDIDSSEYERTRFLPRPGHADYTAFMKYKGYNDYRGGGRFSGRITATYVMVGAIAKKLLSLIGVEVLAHTIELGGIRAESKQFSEIRENTDKNPVRCADPKAAKEMVRLIQKIKLEGDSIGGIVEGIVLNVPVGLGEPVFDTLEGDLAKALFAIPGIKGVEFGTGFSTTRKRGTGNNDAFTVSSGKGKKIVTVTNNAGGILGGISNGMPIVVRVAVKPTPSITKFQQTVNVKSLEPTPLTITGRHDVCIVPKVIPVVESMMAITLCDFLLRAGLLSRIV